jgi:hypothetical protein
VRVDSIHALTIPAILVRIDTIIDVLLAIITFPSRITFAAVRVVAIHALTVHTRIFVTIVNAFLAIRTSPS